jgi:hypothetical protein
MSASGLKTTAEYLSKTRKVLTIHHEDSDQRRKSPHGAFMEPAPSQPQLVHYIPIATTLVSAWFFVVLLKR